MGQQPQLPGALQLPPHQARRASLELHSHVVPLGGGRAGSALLGPVGHDLLAPFLASGLHPQGGSAWASGSHKHDTVRPLTVSPRNPCVEGNREHVFSKTKRRSEVREQHTGAPALPAWRPPAPSSGSSWGGGCRPFSSHQSSQERTLLPASESCRPRGEGPTRASLGPASGTSCLSQGARGWVVPGTAWSQAPLVNLAFPSVTPFPP